MLQIYWELLSTCAFIFMVDFFENLQKGHSSQLAIYHKNSTGKWGL